jgi:hypothetical protein
LKILVYRGYTDQGSLPGHELQHWLKAEADLTAERNLIRVHGFHHQTKIFSRKTNNQ